MAFDLMNGMFLARKRRTHHTQFVSYREEEVPTKPSMSAVQTLENKRVLPATIDQIKTVWNSDHVLSGFDSICDR